jgi:anaphase-promoting complex subunit 2
MSKPQTLMAALPPGGVLASVFPSGLKPPSHRQRFAQKRAIELPEIQRALKSQLKTLLGIGDEQFVYGEDRWVPDAGAPFHSHLASCAPLKQLRHPTPVDHATQITRENSSPTWATLSGWRSSVGSEKVMRLLAAVLNDLITDFVTWSYAGNYRDDLYVHLDFWVLHLFSRIAHKALCCLDERFNRLALDEAQVKKWGDTAMARLGALRVDELFDIVVEWDTTKPAIEDLRHFVTNPATRGYLTHEFANVLHSRLLHPGASTIEILQIYISIIRSFRLLDPRGVLLDRVAKRIRRYLREREDTVKVIVNGLLADTVPGAGATTTYADPDVLSELALELQRRNAGDNAPDESEFDWNNMDWVPDPVDAAPDYMKSSKNTDVIGSLITLFETKDVFVKELQSTLAERLLKKKTDFNQEISVLEHLKIRFGDSALQGCEVMLRDVLDSRKVDQVIRRDLEKDKTWSQLSVNDGGLEIHTKILSRLFWPSMPDQSFNVPTEVLDRQKSYEKGFEALKQSRRLTWLNGMGQVKVELELEDRTVSEEVLPWQAAVIHAFRSDEPGSQQVSKTITQLASDLAMSPMLVRSACIFWASKHVLAETAANTFSVLETLPADGTGAATSSMDHPTATQANTAAAAEAAALAAAKEAEEAERKQKMAMYHQFIVSMLTNQGAMPLARIAMMLGIVVPGGFPFSNEELKDFLGSMVKDGALEVGNAGVYKVAS